MEHKKAHCSLFMTFPYHLNWMSLGMEGLEDRHDTAFNLDSSHTETNQDFDAIVCTKKVHEPIMRYTL